MVHGSGKSVCGGGGDGGTKPNILTKREENRVNGNQEAEQTVQRIKTYVFTGK